MVLKHATFRVQATQCARAENLSRISFTCLTEEFDASGSYAPPGEARVASRDRTRTARDRLAGTSARSLSRLLTNFEALFPKYGELALDKQTVCPLAMRMLLLEWRLCRQPPSPLVEVKFL